MLHCTMDRQSAYLPVETFGVIKHLQIRRSSMSVTSQSPRYSAWQSLTHWIGGALHNIGGAIDLLHRANEASHDFERLNRYSDRQLAALNLARTDIPSYVAAKYFNS
jgi:hypothetical protein